MYAILQKENEIKWGRVMKTGRLVRGKGSCRVDFVFSAKCEEAILLRGARMEAHVTVPDRTE